MIGAYHVGDQYEKSNHWQGYCLDRGNGQFTRLIPADMLPPLNEVPAREETRGGMIVLPPLGPMSGHGTHTPPMPYTVNV